MRGGLVGGRAVPAAPAAAPLKKVVRPDKRTYDAWTQPETAVVKNAVELQGISDPKVIKALLKTKGASRNVKQIRQKMAEFVPKVENLNFSDSILFLWYIY